MAQRTPEVGMNEVQKHLGGIDYPVSKDQLLDHARRNDATDEVMQLMRRMPDQQYDSPVDVSKALGDIE